MSAKPVFSLNDLQKGAKSLNATETTSHGSKDTSDVEARRALEDLYEKYDGDLDRIFDELRADPSKAKKPHHRPKDAREFAVKYLEGYYSLVKDEDIDSRADSKSHK
eukprot:gene2911-3096_t